jgi:hypothetical protein
MGLKLTPQLELYASLVHMGFPEDGIHYFHSVLKGAHDQKKG